MDNPPKGGWKDMTDVEDWITQFPWEEQLTLVQKGQTVPFIFIDKPFIKNAVYMLEIMNGFIVEKGKKGCYEISLL